MEDSIYDTNRDLPYYLSIIILLTFQMIFILWFLFRLYSDVIYHNVCFGLSFILGIISLITYFHSLNYIEKFQDKKYVLCSFIALLGMLMGIGLFLSFLVINLDIVLF